MTITAQASQPIDIYARVSRKGDKEQRSTSGQVGYCRAVLAERGLPEGETLVDDGRSAWNPRVVRKDWGKLMARLESGASGGVIVFDLERFSRQPAEGERLIAAAERGLLVLDSDAEFDLTTASGKKGFRDALSAAAYYSDRLSDRVKRGVAAKARAGQVNGGKKGKTRRPFGWEPDGVTVREDEAGWLRWMTEHFLHGDSQDALIAHLNARGITTTTGGPWTRAGFRQVLTRERNRGNIEHNGVVVARLPGDPVIDSATFERVLAKYAARRPGRPPSRDYVASGHAVCGLCGKRLGGRPRKDYAPYPDGSVRRHYWCSPSTYGGCGKVVIDQRELDEAARALTIAVLADPAHASQVEAAAAREDNARGELDKLIAGDEATKLAIGGRLGRGEITLEHHDAIMGPLYRRLAELRAARDALGGPVPEVDAALSAGAWADRWDGGTPTERRALLARALRGRVLAVGPAGPGRDDVTARITLRPAAG